MEKNESEQNLYTIDLWKPVYEYLCRNTGLSPAACHLWFRELWCLKLDENNAWIGTNKSYIQAILNSRYRPVIESALKAVYGRKLQPVFLCREDG